MKKDLGCSPTRLDGSRFREESAMTLVEVIIALAIVVMVFGTIIEGYIASAKMTQWSGFSLAAQSAGQQVLEQAKSAVWDPTQSKCEITNFPLIDGLLTPNGSGWSSYTGYLTNIMDVPWKASGYVVVTNFVTFKMITLAGNTNVQVILARVDSVWPFNAWGKFEPRVYTNTICAYFAPDNPDASALAK